MRSCELRTDPTSPRPPVERRQIEIAVGAANVTSPLNLNVVLHVPSRHRPDDFEGVRTGRLSKERALPMVQAAIPPGRPSGNPEAVVGRLLLDAVAAAESFAGRRGIASDLQALEAVARWVTR
jgi:hypothetical protein